VTAQVTALGIRDGDPTVLKALVDRRGAAVLAYCERACPVDLAPEASADAFARFRTAVIATPRPADLDPEAALLSATRHAAAERAPRTVGTSAGPIGRLLGGKAPDQIAEVPSLLVLRAEGTLDAASEDRLNRLLDASAAARAAEERFHAAEYAYRTAVARPLPPVVARQVIATMTAIAPTAAPGETTDDFEPFAEAPVAEEPMAHDPVVEQPGTEEPSVGDEPDAIEEPVAESPPAEEPPGQAPAVEEPAVEEPPAVDEPPAEPPAVEDPEPAGAVSMDTVDPGATEEWALPEDERSGEDLEIEVAAARLQPEPGEDDPEHLQSASGAVEEPLVDDRAEQLQRPHRRPVAPVASVAPPPPPKEPRTSTALPRLPAERPTIPARSAFAPATAVVAIAAIGAMVASGVFGGNESTAPLDTGIVRPRAVNAIPEGEAKTVVNDLREAAAQARRQRLADQRQTIAAAPAATEEAEDTEPAPPAQQEQPEAPRDEPAPATPEPEDEAGEAPADEPAPEPENAAPEGDAEGAIPGDAP